MNNSEIPDNNKNIYTLNKKLSTFKNNTHYLKNKQINKSMSTLELWQAHLKSLNNASNEPDYNTDITNLEEQSVSVLVVPATDNDSIN